MKPTMLFIGTLLLLSACQRQFTTQPTSIAKEWRTYSSNAYHFSVRYPAELEIKNIFQSTFFIGDRIGIQVNENNPLDCRGGCPIIESQEWITLAGHKALKLRGYIGGDGAIKTPEQYLEYVIQRGELYLSFRLYAVGYAEVPVDPAKIATLLEADILQFEKIMESLEFTE